MGYQIRLITSDISKWCQPGMGEFRHRTRIQDESFMEYSYALKRLAIRAFPKITRGP